jgi:hypothetical protein
MSIVKSPVYFLSTAHIQEPDACLLALHAGDNDSPIFADVNAALIANTHYGFLLWIADEGPPGDASTRLQVAGFSAAFAALLTRVHQETGGSCYLMLDRDAEPLEDLQTFEW